MSAWAADGLLMVCFEFVSCKNVKYKKKSKKMKM